MEYRRLGRTGLEVSVVGLGSGGASKLGQRYNLSRDEVSRLVRRALDLGINMIDTAPGYGESEALLGDVLADVPRDSYVLATKFWPMQGGTVKPAAELRRSIDESLGRLRTDHVDVFFLHAVPADRYTQIVDEYGGVLDEIRRKGLARHLGVTEQYVRDHDHQMVQAAAEDGRFDVAMIGYNLISPAAALRALPAVRARDVGVLIMCAVRRVIAEPEMLRTTIRGWKDEGLLTADAVPDDAPLDWLLGPGVSSLTDAAYKFAADNPAVSSVLTGTGNVEHLEANVRAVLDGRLPSEQVRRVVDLFGPVGRNAGSA